MSTLRAKKSDEVAKERGGDGGNGGNKDEESEPFLDTSDTDSKGHPITSSSNGNGFRRLRKAVRCTRVN
ncbi:hypothetical protein TYRP_022235 [Tyrophagus putrescentiae]|nr:hypothetical protein TYRP_022235 [Tyrophagus putrescentiae]